MRKEYICIDTTSPKDKDKAYLALIRKEEPKTTHHPLQIVQIDKNLKPNQLVSTLVIDDGTLGFTVLDGKSYLTALEKELLAIAMYGNRIIPFIHFLDNEGVPADLYLTKIRLKEQIKENENLKEEIAKLKAELEVHKK